MIIVYILLFIVCLSTLIAVHELGHLATAKIFKVYCFEYALGFGPKLFSRKRKNGETYFSIRAIPFGGFVSMYGESESIPEGITVDPSRSLLAIKKWKRAIIMASGIVMNFLLAIVIFFVYNVAFPVYTSRYGHITVSKNSLASQAGLASKNAVHAELLSYNSETLVFYDDEAIFDYGTDFATAYIGFSFSNLSIKDTSLRNHAVAYQKKAFGELGSFDVTTTVSETLQDYHYDELIHHVNGFMIARAAVKKGNNYVTQLAIADKSTDDLEHILVAEFTLTKEEYNSFLLVPVNGEVDLTGQIIKQEDKDGEYPLLTITSYSLSYPDVKGNNLFKNKYNNLEPRDVSFNLYVLDESSEFSNPHSLNDVTLSRSGETYYMPKNLGLSMQLDKRMNNFGESVKNTFVDFGDSAVLIFRGLGSLLTTSDGWKNMGGIIAIGVTTTQILQENGFGLFLFYWAVISVNLGIINLLPFPGLDGWHLLVIAVEAIFRKEIPAKVKNIVSFVGVMILLALMILILVKDIITYI